MASIFQPTLAEIRSRREKWDRRFLDMVKLVGSWSKDPSTQVGAVIVRPDQTIASVGYNGFPRGMDDDDSLYANREVKYSRIVHGEMNAILNAHGPVVGYTLYVPMLCCDRCAVHVIQAGIKRVVCCKPSADMESRWGAAFKATRAMFSEADVQVMEYDLERLPERVLVTVQMPSVNGEKEVGVGHSIDLNFLATKVDIGSDDNREAFVRGMAQKIGQLTLGEVPAHAK